MEKDLIRDAINNLPTYTPGKQADEAAKEFKVKDVIKLASNENPLGPSPMAIEALVNNAKGSSIYPDQHHIHLKEALAGKLGISKEELLIGNGSDEIMVLIAQVFLSAGQEAVISRNTFSMYEFAVKLMEGKIIYVDLKDYKYDLDSIKKSVNERTKLIFLCNPNNPTGTIFNKKELEGFLNSVPEEIITVLDEAYGDYADDPDYPAGINYVKNGKNVIILRTFSKIYGLAGLRVGYAIAKPVLIKYLSMAKMPFNVGRLSQLAAVEALKDEDFISKSLKNNAEGKSLLYRELKRLKLKYLKTQANFVFIEFEDRSADQVFMELMKSGIIVRPLGTFGFPNAIRVTVGTKLQNEAFIKAMEKVL